MSGLAALLVVDARRSMPTPVTSSAVLEAFTDRLSVPMDSRTALPVARLIGLTAENVTVGNLRIPALIVIVPVNVFDSPSTKMPDPDLVNPLVPTRTALMIAVELLTTMPGLELARVSAPPLPVLRNQL